MAMLNDIGVKNFQQHIWNFYAQEKRAFAWRNVDDPYKVLVSEVMLQQTQTYRVEKKFSAFIRKFPDFTQLAHATLHDILQEWQGLGYNRRARYLYLIAQRVVEQHNNMLPCDPDLLKTFPGIGHATASSICAFAFNMPTAFIETNIRAVFIHHFFQEQDRVDDRHITEYVAATLDTNNPREWYYALMDYGVMLKKYLPNPNKKSKHYAVQSSFKGSDRQIRGNIIKSLLAHRFLSREQILCVLNKDIQCINKIINQMVHEKLIIIHDDQIMIA